MCEMLGAAGDLKSNIPLSLLLVERQTCRQMGTLYAGVSISVEGGRRRAWEEQWLELVGMLHPKCSSAARGHGHSIFLFSEGYLLSVS